MAVCCSSCKPTSSKEKLLNVETVPTVVTVIIFHNNLCLYFDAIVRKSAQFQAEYWIQPEPWVLLIM